MSLRLCSVWWARREYTTVDHTRASKRESMPFGTALVSALNVGFKLDAHSSAGADCYVSSVGFWAA